MIPKYFDAHTHLNIQFDNDWQEVGQRALNAGVAFVNVGADVERSKMAVEQAKYFDANGFATVGIHPTEIDAESSQNNEENFSVIEELAKDDHVVAIGECGLEYFRINDEAIKQKQKELFIKHIELALKVNKPLMIHCRVSQKDSTDAYDDILIILKDYHNKVGNRLRFNMHFFVGDWNLAQKFIDIGGYLSFTGVITFADQYDEVVKKMPLDRLMAETDAPFVTPKALVKVDDITLPERDKRNEPIYVAYVAERIAELRSESREMVLTTLVANTKHFFNL